MVSVAGYEIQRLLGEGGMGRVYEAIHTASQSRVALKTVRPDLATAVAWRTLLNEASIVAQLRHPNVVELLDVGRDEAGGMYLVVELVEGGDLESWHVWPGLTQVQSVMADILAALSAAHAESIVHGDLKPANVLLTSDGRAKVADFGIARAADPLRERASDAPSGGTPLYMAPEQFGTGGLVGPWSDLYAVGVMLHELFSGSAPFTADTLPLLLLRKTDAPVLVPRKGLELPTETLELVARLLDPNPRKRPRFAADVARLLASSLERANDWIAPTGAVGIALDPTSTPDEIGRLLKPTTSQTEISGQRASTSIDSSPPSHFAESEAPTLLQLRAVPFIGRVAEHSVIESLAAEVLSHGGARVALVVGEPGVGKSRLASHVYGEVERAGRMERMAAGYDPSGSTLSGGLKHAFRRLLGHRPTPAALAWIDDGEIETEILRRWLADEESLAPGRVVDLAHQVLRSVSRTRPVYLWLDDAVWADDGALELCARLLDAGDVRILIVATARGGAAEHPAVRGAIDRISAHPNSRVLPLTRMDEEERARLLSAIAPLAPDVLPELARALDQPPLVLVHLVHDWIASGLLEPGHRGWRPSASRTVGELLRARPQGAIFGQRLDLLLDGMADRAAAVRVLHRASLLGNRFGEDLLRASVTSPSDDVDAVLDHALLGGLLRVEPDGDYRFEHGLFQETLLERLKTDPDRDRAYRDVARALLAAYGHRNADALVRVATLLRTAGDREEAWPILEEASMLFAREARPTAALETARRVSEWLTEDEVPESDPRWDDALFREAHALYFCLRYSEALAVLERVGARPSDLERRRRVLQLTVSTLFYQDRFLEAERASLDPLVANDFIRAELAVLRGDLARAQGLLLAFADRTDDDWMRHIASANAAELTLAMGDVPTARAILDRLAPNATRGDAYRRVVGELHARVALCEGHVEEARSLLAPVLRQAAADPWRRTAALSVEALISASIDSTPDVERVVRSFLAAWAKVHQDEAFTAWALERLIEKLRARSMPVAEEVARVLERRRAEVARGFLELTPGS